MTKTITEKDLTLKDLSLINTIQKNKSIVIVVDEFGGTAGLVTIEDIIEEIIGEIDDEHDRNEFVEKKISENEFILSGRLEIKHLNEVYNLNIDIGFA